MKKYNREKKEQPKGEGLYVFENNTKADLFLPRPTASGRILVKSQEQFQGDNYYFCLLGKGLKLIREINSVEQTRKLLTEQPPIVTTEGTVELVAAQAAKKPLNENRPQKSAKKDKDVLLNEGPIDGIDIL